MNNIFRGLIAGYGAKKLGGGCFSTILIFIVLWMLLGMCDDTAAAVLPDPTPVVLQLDYAPTTSPIASGIAAW